MSSSQHKKFIFDSKKISFDLEHRRKIKFNMSKYNLAVDKGRLRYNDLNNTRNRAGNAKRKALLSLPELLLQFEENCIKNGTEVLWASDSHEAISQITGILKDNQVSSVIKSKSMTTEEIELNEELEKIGVKAVESDLGEYIVQLAGEKPYHIVTPAMHKSKQDVAILFNEKFDLPLDSTAEDMTMLARKNLREDFLNAGAGITGGNFVIADIGGIAITENEGNAILSTSFPKIHIAVVGIEKIIPSVKDLGYMWPHLSAHGTGQAISVYNSIFTGSKKDGEEGPEKMYIILLDNGRSDIYANADQRASLSCIRCGACLNACPIYKNVGGYTYATTYQGPIGSVISPHLLGFKEFKHLSSACSLCGNCTEVCPVKIPLHELLLDNRKKAVEQSLTPTSEKIGMKGYAKAMTNRSLLDLFGGGIKNSLLKAGVSKIWGEKRSFPMLAKKSFNKQWKEKN